MIALNRHGVRVWLGGSGPTVVLLHGGMADAEQHWSRIWDRLAAHHEVVAPDLPGFGGSAPLPETRWASLAEWVLARIGATERVSLVGNSFGGTLARVVASLHPERVERLVLVDGGQFVRAPPWVPRLGPLWALAERRGVPRASVTRMFHGPVPPGLDRSHPGAIWSVARDCLRGPTPERSPSCPTLVVWGEQDRHTPLARAHALLAELPGARLASIPNAGHLPQVEQPDAFLAAVSPFLAQGAGAATTA